MISSAAQHSDAEDELTADCFNETGKHCRSGGVAIGEGEQWRGTPELYMSLGHPRRARASYGEPVVADLGTIADTISAFI